MNFKLRVGSSADAEACGVICYEAFKAISEHHNFPPDFPSSEVVCGLLSSLFSLPNVSDFSALCSRPGCMRAPGEIPMKVLMTKGFLATRSHASKPCVSIRELAGTRCTSMPVMPGGTGKRNRYQNFFSFTYFHGLSAARPLGWPLRMTNGKVSEFRSTRAITRLHPGGGDGSGLSDLAMWPNFA
jgi:hypothetical protein